MTSCCTGEKVLRSNTFEKILKDIKVESINRLHNLTYRNNDYFALRVADTLTTKNVLRFLEDDYYFSII